MSIEPNTEAPSKGLVWTGRAVTALVVLFLTVDAGAKIAKLDAVLRANVALGLPLGTVTGIGTLLLVCTAIYAIPRTSVLGAILLTGYLGGAVAIHVRAGSPLFPILFSFFFGVLVWVGLVLREVRLVRTILLRR